MAAAGQDAAWPTCRPQWKCLPQKIVEIPPTAPAAEAPEGMVLSPRRQVSLQGLRRGDRRGRRARRRLSSIPGKICRGAITTRRWTSRRSTSTSTRSPTPSSSGSSTPRATSPRTTTTSSRTGRTARIPAGWDQQAGHLGLAGGRPGLRRLGRQAAAARMGMAVRGAGRRTAGRIPGATSPMPRRIPKPETGRELRRPTDVDAYPQGRQPVGRDGPGGQRLAMDRRISSTSTPARRSFAAAATTGPAARSGTSRRTRGSTSTGSIC